MKITFNAIGLALGLGCAMLPRLAVAGMAEADAAYEQKNYIDAASELQVLASAGDTRAQYNLGLMYNLGEGVPRDYKEAAKWYRLAAARGMASAQFNLGSLYGDGQGVPQDYKEAVVWHRLAAAQGLASAQSNLGSMYGNGEGLTKNLSAAYALANIAATNDSSTENRALSLRKLLTKYMTPRQIEAGQALSREMLKTGNFLKALDRFTQQNP